MLETYKKVKKLENKMHSFAGLEVVFCNLLRVPKYQIVWTCDYVLQV